MVNGAMFKFAMVRQVMWPVTIQVPQDGGAVKEMEIHVQYKLLTQEELAEWVKEDLESVRAVHQDGDSPNAVDNILAELGSDRLARRVEKLKTRITGWGSMVDEEGKPLPFTPEYLDAILRVPYLRAPIDRGLVQASRGAPAKNSEPGSDGSPTPTGSGPGTVLHA